MPRPLIAAALLLCGCNEIRYQASRLRANAPKLEVPKAASLPDRRATYECKDGEPFDVYFPPGGVGAVLSPCATWRPSPASATATTATSCT